MASQPRWPTAIREHYLPRGAGDALPATATGTAVALADKLDTLAGIFAIGQKPTGTQDPFGLRRAAIGVLRIVLEQRLELDLAGCWIGAVARVRADIEKSAAAAGKPAPALATASVAAEVYDFVLERLRAQYLERAAGTSAITTEMFDAVLATRPASPLDFDARLRRSCFLARPEAASLAAANKRIANILRKAGESAPVGDRSGCPAALPAERQLSRPCGSGATACAAAAAAQGLRRLAGAARAAATGGGCVLRSGAGQR